QQKREKKTKFEKCSVHRCGHHVPGAAADLHESRRLQVRGAGRAEGLDSRSLASDGVCKQDCVLSNPVQLTHLVKVFQVLFRAESLVARHSLVHRLLRAAINDKPHRERCKVAESKMLCTHRPSTRRWLSLLSSIAFVLVWP